MTIGSHFVRGDFPNVAFVVSCCMTCRNNERRTSPTNMADQLRCNNIYSGAATISSRFGCRSKASMSRFIQRSRDISGQR